jgi:two-component system, chemotaxis family, CheB/CheR fusion protein
MADNESPTAASLSSASSQPEHADAILTSAEAPSLPIVSVGASLGQQPSDTQISRLTHELAATREHLQSVIEQQEAANEELQNRNLELSQANNDFINLLSSVQLAIIMLGRDLRIRRFTPAAEKILNLIPADVGRPISDIKLNLSVADLDRLLIEVIDTVAVKELDVQDKEGRWHSLRIRPYKTLENKIDGAVIVLVDVDRLKRAEQSLRESEERLSLATQCAGMGTVDMDLLSGKTIWSESRFRIFGYEPPPDAEASWDMGVSRLHPDDRDRVLAAFEQAKRDRTIYSPEHRIVRADNGQVTWLLTFGRFLYDESGTAVRFVGISLDNTQRKMLEQSFQQRAEELAAADRSKNHFLAMLAHELRNPLAPLRNAVEVLRGNGGDQEVSGRALDIMDRQIQNMVRIVEDLLDVSRVSRGQIQLRKEPCDVAACLKNAVELARHMVQARDQKLSLALPNESVCVEADSTRLEQVFGNLLTNASKFTEPHGHIWLELTSEAVPVGGRQAVVRVRDDGIGISEDMLPRIFDLFAQADGSAARRQGGLGIGLTLVRRLVELHGGSVEVQSGGLAKGCEFTIRLPELKVRPAPRAPEKPFSHSGGNTIPKRRVLLVDDNVDVAESMAMLLRDSGHEVRIAHSGTDALQAATASKPEVILLDIGLPDMDGYEVAQRIRQRPDMTKTCLVALTGYGQDEDRDHARQAGFDYHLTKPTSLAALEDILARA